MLVVNNVGARILLLSVSMSVFDAVTEVGNGITRMLLVQESHVQG